LRLLVLLDALVRKDLTPPGVTGNVCIGVTRPDRQLFWLAKVGAAAQTAFYDQRPPHVDSCLVLDADTAENVLTKGALPATPGRLEMSGNASLMFDFLNRYLAASSPLQMRIATARG